MNRVTCTVLGVVGAMSLGASAIAQPCVSWAKRSEVGGPGLRATVAPLAYDPTRNRTMLFGGQLWLGASGYTFYNDLWSWDGSNWSAIAVTGSKPIARSSGGVAFDRGRDRLVIFGGYRSDTPRARDTWEFNPVSGTWANLSNTGPTGRYEPAMVYDEARSVCLLFGGNDGTAARDDTWTWNGIAWTQLNPAVRPPGRWRPMVAYDSVRQVVVLFGGAGAGTFTDTWEWNGVAWSQRATSGPPAATYQAMTFDRTRGVTVLNAGRGTPAVPSGDVWEWNGASWTRRVADGPPARYAHGMAYDEARQEVVLFGGLIDGGTGGVSSNRGDTWVLTADELGVSAPASYATCLGGRATFSVTAYSTEAPVFSWRRGDIVLSDGPTGTGSVVSGAATATLTITHVGDSDVGVYGCVLTNGCGIATSPGAALTITCRNLADVASIGGSIGCDAQLTADDIIGYLDRFFANDLSVADLVGLGGSPGRDGLITPDDLISFLGAFFAGC